MPSYYAEKLSAERLRGCYEVAPPRVKQYLDAEIEFILASTTPSTCALELGCGYGRVLKQLLPYARKLVGIDSSFSSLRMVQEYVGRSPALHLSVMDAACLGFRDQSFDLTICIQNGICAFHTDQQQLFKEAVRVTRSGGIVLFSSYSERFWQDRLEWFEAQAAHGFIGPIDHEATGDGIIVCRDGLKLTTMSPTGFRDLAKSLDLKLKITEVDTSSIFCEITVHCKGR